MITINLSPLFIVIGIFIIGTVAEKVLSKGGNETGAYIVGLVGLLIGFMIVIGMLKNLIMDIMNTFIP